MNDKTSLHSSPQLDYNNEQLALALSAKQIHSLYKRSLEYGVSMDVILEVYRRGGFNRVDSFLHDGKASILDRDLLETTTSEPISTNPDEPASRFIGTDQLTKILVSQTPGQQRADTIKRVVRDTINNNKKDSSQ